jgi:hypothetical protein
MHPYSHMLAPLNTQVAMIDFGMLKQIESSVKMEALDCKEVEKRLNSICGFLGVKLCCSDWDLRNGGREGHKKVAAWTERMIEQR